jgi:hypothetical protein
MVAIIRIIATTIRSSSSEKPRFVFTLILNSADLASLRKSGLRRPGKREEAFCLLPFLIKLTS